MDHREPYKKIKKMERYREKAFHLASLAIGTVLLLLRHRALGVDLPLESTLQRALQTSIQVPSAYS
jgi:hypothetical protein